MTLFCEPGNRGPVADPVETGAVWLAKKGSRSDATPGWLAA